MKSPLLLLALSWALGVPCLFAKSELETLRSLCAEQERQIHQLEEDNAKLRSLSNLTTTRSADPRAPRRGLEPPSLEAARHGNSVVCCSCSRLGDS